MWLYDGLYFPEFYGLLPLPSNLSLKNRTIFFKSVLTVVKSAIYMEQMKSVIWEFGNLLDTKIISKFVRRQKSNVNAFWDHLLDIDMGIYNDYEEE